MPVNRVNQLAVISPNKLKATIARFPLLIASKKSASSSRHFLMLE